MTAAEPTPARWAGAFDSAAADFARLGPLLWEPIGRATVTAVHLRPGQRVLDACCGNGASAVPAAHDVGRSGAVDAVDLSPAMIDHLRSRAGDLPQMAATAADVTTWPGKGYDAVLCVLGAFFFPDMDGGTEHLVRCARPGGVVAVTFWRTGTMVEPGMALARAVARERGEPVPGDPPRGRLQELGAPHALADWLTDRGATGVRVGTVPHAVPTDEEALWLLVLGSGFRGMLAGLGDDAVARVRADYLGRLAGGPPADATTLVAVGHRPG